MKINALLCFFLPMILLGKRHYRILEEKGLQKAEVVPVVDPNTNPELICNYEIMRSYGMRGSATPKLIAHKYCPSVTNNCCTEEDAETANKIWKSDIKARVERYYQIYDYAFRYMLGFTQEAFLLARKFSILPNLECKRASNDLLAMNLNPKITFHIESTIRKTIASMANIRRGFYCSICDANVQNYFKDFFATTNLAAFSKLYYSKDFCLSLVEDTIESSFYIVSYLQRYLNDVVVLMDCQTGAVEKPQFNLKDFKSEDIKNCFFFRNKYFFFFCQKYCNEFSLVTATPILDGDIMGLKPFVDFFVKYRLESFEYPRNNILMDGIQFEENFLIDMYGETLRDVVFYRPTAEQNVFLDQMATEVTSYGGMNPIPATLNAKFELQLYYAGFVKMWALLFVIGTLF